MKYSTYIMIAAFSAGLICSIIIAITILSTGEPWQSEAIHLNGKTIDVRLPEFKYADISIYTRGEKYYVDNFRGIEITECDTLNSPIMQLPEGLNAILRHNVANDTLFLEVDPAIVCDTIKSRHTIMLRSQDIHPITIFIPKGSLKGVKNISYAVYFSHVVAPTIDVQAVNSRIVLDGCVIDTIRSDNRHIREIKLSDSHINVLQLNNGTKSAAIVCTDNASSIKKLTVKAPKSVKRCELSLDKANIGEFEWCPADSTTELNLRITKPLLITSSIK